MSADVVGEVPSPTVSNDTAGYEDVVTGSCEMPAAPCGRCPGTTVSAVPASDTSMLVPSWLMPGLNCTFHI